MKAEVPLGQMSTNCSNDIRRDPDNSFTVDTVSQQASNFDSTNHFFPTLVKQVQKITQCDYVAIMTPGFDNVTPLTESNSPVLQCASTDCSNYRIQLQELLFNLKEPVLPKKPLILTSPISGSLFCANAVNISSAFLLPLMGGNKILSFCLVANRRKKCDEKILTHVIPAINSLLNAFRAIKKRRLSLTRVSCNKLESQFLSTLLEVSPTGVLVIDEERKIVVSNNKALQMLTVKQDEKTLSQHFNHSEPQCLIGRNIVDFIPNFVELFNNSDAKLQHLPSYLCLEHSIYEDQRILREDRSEFMVNISAFSANSGTQRYCALQLQDLSQIKSHADEYRLATQQLNALSHLVPVGILRLDENWTCIYGNDKWYELSGLTNEECRGTQWINALHECDVKDVLEQLRETMKKGENFKAEVRLASPLGQVKWVELNAQLLFNEEGNISGLICTFADITERLQQQEKLQYCAEFDNLTGLANRNLFQQKLQHQWRVATQSQTPTVVFFIDLDGFKDINDTLGHDAGDQLLRSVACRLVDNLYNTDTVARFGGDEFVVLLSTVTTKEQSQQVASKLIKALAEPYMLNEESAYVSASVGIAIVDDASQCSPEDILKQADSALYLAKAEGKNNFQFYSDELQQEALQRINLANQLRCALAEDRFYMVYQPQGCITSNKIVGVEALLRLKDHDNATIYPDTFIPVLEQTGMIVTVGAWIIEQSLRQLRAWCNEGLLPAKGFMSINVSPKQLLNGELAEHIASMCNKYQLLTSYITLELTETVIIDKPQKVAKALAKLKAIGVQLALDDFGTGYSSLTYLQKFPFDHIKIDKSFVIELANDTNDDKITRSIIALGQSLGLKVTAEGVERKAALTKLSELGATKYQGYFLAKPAEGHHMSELILNRATQEP